MQHIFILVLFIVVWGIDNPLAVLLELTVLAVFSEDDVNKNIC